MNKKEIFEATLTGKIGSKNYKKHDLSKSKFYKIYSRVLFYRKITDPVKLMILNLSEREFQAVRNNMLKTELPSKKPFKSFHMRGKNRPQNEGETR